MYLLRKFSNPEIYQGKNKRKSYFEGWYYRLADAKAEQVLTIIPGVSLCQWDTHAFIQVIDSMHKSYYFHYNIDDFEYNENTFEIKIGENYFSKSRISLNLINLDYSLCGDLYFCNILEYPRTFLRPGVMGPFLHIPGFDCYHDIINIQHDIIGHLKVSGDYVDFTSGIGYIEKNWGRSMPKSWLWFQCNHFVPDDVSVSVRIASLHHLAGSFTGFIVMFRYRDRIFMFSSYSGARFSKLYCSGNKIRLAFKDCRFRLDMLIAYSSGATVKAPINGKMCRNITERSNCMVKLRFSERSGRILYEGLGKNGGLELVDTPCIS